MITTQKPWYAAKKIIGFTNHKFTIVLVGCLSSHDRSLSSKYWVQLLKIKFHCFFLYTFMLP